MTKEKTNLEKWLELYFDEQYPKNSFLDPLFLRDNIYKDVVDVKKENSLMTDNIYPEKSKLFAAFEYVAPEDVKVVIIGQDPYHTPNQAQGLAFSLPDTAKTQPSMRNILKELKDDLEVEKKSQDLTSWAKQGVLLLNASLTVKEGEPNSMAKIWKPITTHFVEKIVELNQPVVFILWGNFAQQFAPLIKGKKDMVISAHPSPFSARRGFFGSKPFSKTNSILESYGITSIDWGD